MTERVVVEIGEIVLDGVRPADRDRVTEAFTGELSRLLRTRGLPGPDASREVVPGSAAVPHVGSPRRLGRMLARTVHETLTAPRRPDDGPTP
jgi:hypothetical protein